MSDRCSYCGALATGQITATSTKTIVEWWVFELSQIVQREYFCSHDCLVSFYMDRAGVDDENGGDV